MGRNRARSLADLPKWVRQQADDLTVAVPQHMMGAAVRIVGDIDDASHLIGRKRGTIGTGFVVVVPSETLANVRYAYVVTAHHVIDLQTKIQVQAENPFAPGQMYPPFDLADWRQPLPGVDLVLCPMRQDNDDGGDQTIQGIAMANEALPPERIPSLGTTIYYIGYLEPLDRMMVRSGTIGAQEVVGMKHSQPEYDYLCHLVDCRSYGGFSGSPCFFTQSHPVLKEQDKRTIFGFPERGGYRNLPVGSMAHISVLCGMFTEHLDDKGGNTDGVVSRYGVGVMLPSLLIWRALMTDEMKGERREWDDERKEAEQDDSGPQIRPASRKPSDDDEYARFEGLAKRLVNTPKQIEEEGDSQ
jgi:hypothetical protein